MIRSEDYSFDTEVEEALEELTSAQSRLRNLRDRLFILQSAYDDIALRGTDEHDTAAGSYGYIPIDLNLFFEGLFTLEGLLAADPDYQHPDLPHRPLRFVEVGCGTGRLVHLLRATDRFAFIDIQGFDLSETMIALGRERYGLGESLFVGDCMEVDYSGYDVIFFYRPMKDSALEQQFEERVIEQMPRGAYLFCFSAAGIHDDRRLLPRDSRFGIYKRL